MLKKEDEVAFKLEIYLIQLRQKYQVVSLK